MTDYERTTVERTVDLTAADPGAPGAATPEPLGTPFVPAAVEARTETHVRARRSIDAVRVVSLVGDRVQHVEEYAHVWDTGHDG
jgi:hypothetical protein